MIIVQINTWGSLSQDSMSILDTMVDKISQQHTNLGELVGENLSS